MKVWGYTDPRTLKKQHLLGEHLEIHSCISGGWKNHPESLFKRFDGEVKWPIFRHELLRIAMNERWPGRHTPEKHKSPVDIAALDDLAPRLEDYRALVADTGLGLDYAVGLPAVQARFEELMTEVGFPETGLDYDRPWEREEVTMRGYWEMTGVRARNALYSQA